MRFLLYNIRYATGTGAAFHLPVPGAGYLRSNSRVLAGITKFIKSKDPDIVGLVEVDTGSIRTGLVNQADVIATSLGQLAALWSSSLGSVSSSASDGCGRESAPCSGARSSARIRRS